MEGATLIGVEETAHGRAIIQPHIPGACLGLGLRAGGLLRLCLGELCRVAGGVQPTPRVRSPATSGQSAAASPWHGCPLPTPAWPHPAGSDWYHTSVGPK